MSVEVENQIYTFLPRPSLRPIRGDQIPCAEILITAMQAGPEAFLKACVVSLPSYHPDPKFKASLRYNPLHDMESLWWIAVYFVLKRQVYTKTPRDQDEHVSQEQRMYASKLFWGELESDRLGAMTVDGSFYVHARPLHPAIQPVVDSLEKLRRLLVQAYETVEQDPPSIDHTSATTLYKPFAETFLRISQMPQLQDVQLRRFAERKPIDVACHDHRHRAVDAAADVEATCSSKDQPRTESVHRPDDDLPSIGENLRLESRRRKKSRIESLHPAADMKPQIVKTVKVAAGRRREDGTTRTARTSKKGKAKETAKADVLSSRYNLRPRLRKA